MNNGLVIADAGTIFSLAAIDRLDILTSLFSEIRIPTAVWDEITRDSSVEHYRTIKQFFKERTVSISGFNELLFVMDKGESEAVVLYRELNADFLLIDDKKARMIAENLGLNCVGTIGILSVAKNKKMIGLPV